VAFRVRAFPRCHATRVTRSRREAAISFLLGFIGDYRSIDPLVEMLRSKTLTASARGFAAVALGMVADKETLLWNSKISTDIDYRANTTTLTSPEATGILDIL